MSPALLEVRELRKHFPLQRALLRAVDGVSFDLERGQSLGLVGESGCGKSTLARTLVGLYPATSGSVRFEGIELCGLSRRLWRPYRRKIQMIFQDPYASLDPRQTVAQILEEPLQLFGLGRRRERRLRALELLDAVGLNPRHLDRYPHEFSGGQRQRIGIARALAGEPDLVVCDEPVSALDVSIQAQIINLLSELRQRFGLAYLFIAHDLAVVRHLCERVAVMYLGKVVELGRREDLFSRPTHPYTRALLSAVPDPDPEALGHLSRIVLTGDVPSPLAPPAGCLFHPRCPARQLLSDDRCAREVPPLLQDGEHHFRACHLPTEPCPP